MMATGESCKKAGLIDVLTLLSRFSSVVGHGRCDYVQRDYSFKPANAALRCQSNKADRSSCAHDDGVIGTDL
jgi:hypothetical protein